MNDCGRTGIFATGNANLAADGAEPERVPRASVTSGFFSVLGKQPTIGRAFLPEEDQPKSEPVAILSNGLWKRRFGSDPNIVGKKISISARPVTVIGVMAAGFEFPEQTQIWATLPVSVEGEPRDNRSYSAIARLKQGVDLQQAQTQTSTINAQLAQSFPDTNKGWDAHVAVLHERLVREVRPALLALLGAVAFVLLIACANVANLLLARAAARQKEVAIRTAIGATRARLVRQMLTESVLLSALGGIVGLLLSVWLTDLLLSIIPEGAPRIDQVGLDYRVLLFAFAAATFTGVLFGLAPALHASKIDVSGSLKEGGRTGEGHRRTSARSLLLVGEVALSLVLLVGAGLLIKSFMRLQNVSPGFNPEHVFITSLSLPAAKYKEGQRPEFFRQLADRLKTLPGIGAVGGGTNLPLAASGYELGRAFIPEGRPFVIDESINASYSTITGDFFRALQIPLLAGRIFADRDADDAPKVVVINESAARRYFGSKEAALGKRLTVWRDEKFPREIVGVVGDTKATALDKETGAQLYVPHAQDTSWNFMALVIRAAGDPAALAPAVRREVRALDQDQPIYNVRTMEDALINSIGARRVSMLLFSVFAGAALLLAAIGIYGVMAYSVTQRTQEIGIRMALGAQRSDVLRMVVRQGMALALVGIAVGLAGAFGLTRALASLLFGVNATDPITFVGISTLLAIVALLRLLFASAPRRQAQSDERTRARMKMDLFARSALSALECGGKRSATPPFARDGAVERASRNRSQHLSEGGVALRFPPHSKVAATPSSQLRRPGITSFRRFGYSLVFAAGLLYGSATPAFSQETRTLTARWMLDVERGALIENGVIVVKGNRIAALGRADEIAPQGEVTKLGEATLGGTGKENALATLRAGFTTVQDLGAIGDQNIKIRDAIREGKFPGPRVVASGPWLGVTGGTCDFNGIGVKGADAFRERVRKDVAGGADLIEICAAGWLAEAAQKPGAYEISDEELRAGIEEAHALKRRVAVHALSEHAISSAVAHGADLIAHGGFTSKETVAAMKQRRVYQLLTLASLKQSAPEAYAKLQQHLTVTVREGLPVAFGTDAGVIPHGENAREFVELAAIGLTPLEAIRAATVHAAAAVGLEGKSGVLKVDALADIIAVEGNPLLDLGALQKIKFATKEGQVIEISPG